MSEPNRPLDHQEESHKTTRTFFVTSSTWGRRSLFQSERMARLFVDVLSGYRTQDRYLLHEFVLMPNHFHGLMSVPPGITIERAAQPIKGGFSYRAKKELGFQGEIWQRGFSDEYIFDAFGYWTRHEYIRQNPVRVGLVQNPEERPYCSAGSEVEIDPMPPHLLGA